MQNFLFFSYRSMGMGLFFLLLFSCNNEPEEIRLEPVIKPTNIEFDSFEEKISFCIGMDHGSAVTQVYNGPKTEGKFDLIDIQSGMMDYLGDEELRIEINAIDSLLNLYLLDNGEVDDSFVSKSDASYAIGIIEAQSLVGSMVGRGIDQKMEISFLLKGILDGMGMNQTTMSIDNARKEVTQYYIEMNQAMGESFLANNAKKLSVIVTESGLQYEVINEGTGITPNLTDSCLVHYTGRFIDGRVFESTIPSAQPYHCTPLGVILGWKEGLLLMKEGGSVRLFVPYYLAYGEQGAGPIEPFSTLVFDIELLKVNRFTF